ACTSLVTFPRRATSGSSAPASERSHRFRWFPTEPERSFFPPAASARLPRNDREARKFRSSLLIFANVCLALQTGRFGRKMLGRQGFWCLSAGLERSPVDLNVGGSSPLTHPKFQNGRWQWFRRPFALKQPPSYPQADQTVGETWRATRRP